MSLRMLVVAGIVTLGMGCSSGEELGSDLNDAQTSDISASPPAPELLSSDAMAKYKAALPKVAFPELQKILDDPGTFWYDAASMVPSYQDSVGDNSGTPIGARANKTAKGIIVPEGKKFFDNTGHWSFPLGHTAGTDASTNIVVANFLSLPIGDDGKQLPVAFRKIDDPNGRGGFGLHKWTWIYPKGTVFGEMIYIKSAAGELLPVELRVRTRFLKGWATNSFRPFPEAKDLEAAIKKARPNWEASEQLNTLMQALTSESGMKKQNKSSTAFPGTFSQQGAVDELPAFGDDALVKELLTKTPFASAYNKVWKQAADGTKSFAPTTSAAVSIVPNNNFIGLIEVNEKSCSRCHKEAGRALDTFESATVLYGDVWGEDQIFSFHPYDPSQYGTFNTENRRVRPLLKDMVVRYNSTTHPADIYRTIQ